MCKFLRYASPYVKPGVMFVYNSMRQNKGSMMGCSNPHPHGQVWSLSVVPSLPAKELTSLRQYSDSPAHNPNSPKGFKDRPCLLCDYAHFEIHNSGQSRVVVKNEHWVAIVPWWATWPFEILRMCFLIGCCSNDSNYLIISFALSAPCTLSCSTNL